MSDKIETHYQAIQKYGTAVDAILALGETIMRWTPSEFGMLIAAMAQEVAAAEKKRNAP